jgi:hypothetical protein
MGVYGLRWLATALDCEGLLSLFCAEPWFCASWASGKNSGASSLEEKRRQATAVQRVSPVASRVVFTVPTAMWDGGLFGNERLWTPRQWLRMLSPFRVEAVFGLSHRGRGARALAFA